MYQRIAAATTAVGLVLGCSAAAFAGTSFTQVTTVNGQRMAVTKTVTDGGNAKAELDVPAATFELPAGFQETALFQNGPALDLNGLN